MCLCRDAPSLAGRCLVWVTPPETQRLSPQDKIPLAAVYNPPQIYYNIFKMINMRCRAISPKAAEFSALQVQKGAAMKKAGINLIEVKERNRALLLQSVCTAGSITRSELSEGLHLSPMTVTNITSELLQKHIIEEFAPQDPIKSPGRTPMLLRICSTSPVVLGIYISRTCLYGVVCDLSLQLLARAKRPLTPIENEESFLQKLRELAEQLTEHTERPILGMGISTVGVISSDASGIAYVTDFFGIRSLNLRDALQPYFRFPIIVCNDMHASGLCELYFGAGKDADSFLYMGITEGLGAALVSHHELLDACGELGHTSIDFGGPRCTCGSRGCLELYASAPAILSLIHDECGVELDSMEQAAGFAMTNKAAYTVFYNAMRQLSFGLNNYLNLVNVSLVVLGHDAAFLPEEFVRYLEQWVADINVSVHQQQLRPRFV